MPKKPTPTAETLLALYRQLSNKERDRFEELFFSDVGVDLESRYTVYALYQNLSEEDRIWFDETTSNGWVFDEARDSIVRANLIVFSNLLTALRRQQQRRRAAEKHRTWKRWHDKEGLSYGKIAQRHKDESGEEVTPGAVAKAIKRFKE